MKKLISLLLFPLLLFSCQQSVIEDTMEGYLRVGDVELAAEEEVLPLDTRAIHEGLQLDIYQGSVCLYSYAADDPALSQTISLPVGTYTLVAHSVNMNEPSDGSAGAPCYSVSREFEIKEGLTTQVEGLVAERVNVGISVRCADELFGQAMTEVSCVITSSSGRTVTVSAMDDPSVYYFSMPSDQKLTYTVRCKNVDGEEFTASSEDFPVEQPKNYVLQFKF